VAASRSFWPCRRQRKQEGVYRCCRRGSCGICLDLTTWFSFSNVRGLIAYFSFLIRSIFFFPRSCCLEGAQQQGGVSVVGGCGLGGLGPPSSCGIGGHGLSSIDTSVGVGVDPSPPPVHIALCFLCLLISLSFGSHWHLHRYWMNPRS
jgi:hypothetical protein